MQHNEKQASTKKTKSNVFPFIPEGEFYFAQGVKAFQKRKFDTALKWLKKASEQDPTEPLYKSQMSIVLTELGDYHSANQVLTDVLQSTEHMYVDCYYLLANNFAHLGLLQDAKKYALLYLENDPEGDFVDETKRLLELVDIDEDDETTVDDEDEWLIYQETIFYHIENLEWQKALKLIEDMRKAFPDYNAMHHDYVQALFYTGQPDKAIQLEEEFLENEPMSLNSWENLAIFYHAHNQANQSQHYIEALQNVFPIQEQQKLRLAVTLARVGRYQDAIYRFRLLSKGIVKSHPSYYRWYSLARFYSGDRNKAINLWKEGIRNHPTLGDENMPWNDS